MLCSGIHRALPSKANQSGMFTLPNRPSEAAMWDELQSAMAELAFSQDEIDGISLTLASVLHVGNI